MIGALYTLGTLITFWLAYYAPSTYMTVLITWLGASLGAVSIAYIFKSPSLFRKQSNGAIPIYIRWLFIPFLFGAQLYNSWARRHDEVPAIQKISNNLFLACRLFPSDIQTLKDNNIKAILDVTAEFDGLDWSSNSEELNYLNIPVLDHQSPTPEQLIHAINWITTHLNNNSGVVVHCALGRGRSVMVMIAYLLNQPEHHSITEALTTIQKIRKTANLNKSQLRRLTAITNTHLLDRKIEQIALVVNPVSGGGKWSEYKHEIIQRLTSRYVIDIYQTTPETSAKSLTQQAIKDGHSLIVGCGGDGTVSEVASQLSVDHHILGIIPLGTTNALSHVLHGTVAKLFPIETTCEILLSKNTKVMDTVKCNKELVLLMVGIGMGQRMIQYANREQKNKSGQLAYLQGLWDAMVNPSSQSLSLITDGETIQVETQSIAIANAAPFSSVLAQGNGAPVWNDGKLDVTILSAKDNPITTFTNMAELATTNITEENSADNIYTKKAESIQISSDKLIKYVIDGENREASHLDIKIVPNSLTVCA